MLANIDKLQGKLLSSGNSNIIPLTDLALIFDALSITAQINTRKIKDNNLIDALRKLKGENFNNYYRSAVPLTRQYYNRASASF
jgi:hypothetical protein